MKRESIYLASGFCLLAFGCSNIPTNNPQQDTVTFSEQTGINTALAQLTNLTESPKTAKYMTVSSNTGNHSDLLYKAAETKYAQAINEVANYGRQPVHVNTMSKAQKQSLASHPKAILLKHRAFIVAEDYQGDDGALYLITERPLIKDQFESLEQLGVTTTNKIHDTVWVATYDNPDAIDKVLQQNFIVGTGRISPLDKISPATLVTFDSTNAKMVQVMITLSKPHQLSMFKAQNPEVVIDETSISYDETLVSATIPQDKLVDVSSSALVDWIENLPPSAAITN